MRPQNRSFRPSGFPTWGSAPKAWWFPGLVACSSAVLANPQGLSVVQGSASTQSQGALLNVTVGQAAFLDWRSFNILPGETTRFIQPSASSVVLNRIGDSVPSQIWGNLSANGTVILANAHGFYFGPNSRIQVGGNFVATTAPLTPDMGGAGGWQFTGPPPLASIVNYGQINAGAGHSLFLIAEHIENHGELRAPGGEVGLHAGSEVLLTERPDGRGLSSTVKLPHGSVDNSGRIIADAGTIAINAQVVNQDGLLKADSVREQNGVIELVGSDSIVLGPNSTIQARGDESGHSAGGRVTIQSGGAYQDTRTATLDVRGGLNGGDGGQVEISAVRLGAIQAKLDGSAKAGSAGGQLVIDPRDIVIQSEGTDSTAGGTVNSGSDPGSVLVLDPGSAFQGFANITLQATGNISIAQGVKWDLGGSTGVTTGGSLLKLQAGQDILFGDGARISDANHWSISLQAGVDFSSGQVVAGRGSIYLNGGVKQTLSGAIETSAGSISLVAGKDVLVGTGFVRTIGQGNIEVQALAGDINTGTKNDGYQFLGTGYFVSSDLGGISTAAGGNVSLTAGHDVISIPAVLTGQTPGASGAYGSASGDVTVRAGNQILGNFTVRNGTGTLAAGVTVVDGKVSSIQNPSSSIGLPTKAVSLSLVSGAWNVYSGGDIDLSEIRNPNGTFNRNRTTVPVGTYPGNEVDGSTVAAPAKSAFLFDYAATAAADLWAGNAINLYGANLPRITGQNGKMPPIYPPQLTLDAGAGGIFVQNSLVLFPSPKGALDISTRDGGNLSGAPLSGGLVGITMSDSGLPDYSTFAQGHATAPLHLNDTGRVRVDVAGSISSLNLSVPLAADVQVKGDTYNFGFLGQNPNANSKTTIAVSGNISYRGNLTDVLLADPLPASVLDPTLSGNPQVAVKLRFDAKTGTLTFIGQMTDNELHILLNPLAVVFDQYGQPVLDGDGNTVAQPVALSTAQKTAIQALYDASQSASLGDNGLAVTGSGLFKVTAHNIDLGISGGITAQVPILLGQQLSLPGAALEVDTTGDLVMTSTRVANETLRGGITVNVGGALDVGGQYSTFGDASAPKGIYTTSGGSITVDAQKNVNVDGSRIATYNGGLLSVVSEHGDVNAGSGGSGFVSFTWLDDSGPGGVIVPRSATIPGSGILTTASLDSQVVPGNIVVSAPEGSIRANTGGILQLSFNDLPMRQASVDLNAGIDILGGDSGVIGNNLNIKAGRNVEGLLVGSGQTSVAGKNVNVVAIGGTGVTIAAEGSVKGTVISGGTLNVSGDSISAALVAKSVNAQGDTSSAAIGVPKSNVAAVDSKVSEDASSTASKKSDDSADEEEKRRRANLPVVVKTIGRVRVFLQGEPAR